MLCDKGSPRTATREEPSGLRAFSSFGERGLLASCGAQTIAGASLAAEHRLPGPPASATAVHALEHRLRSCGAQAWLLRGMWGLPRPGNELVSPALAGGFFTTEPPGKPNKLLKKKQKNKKIVGASLEAQWPASNVGAQAQSLVRELRTHKACSATRRSLFF